MPIKNKQRGKLGKHRKVIVWCIIPISFVLVGVVLVTYAGIFAPSNELPISTIKRITTFHPYYLKPNFSTDFVLQRKSVNYTNGVLEFTMENSVGKKLIFTEERMPVNFDPSTLQTSSSAATEYGQSFITDDTDRTVGSFFSTDKTWVIINAPDPIGSSLMQQFLDVLEPATLSE